MKELLKQIKQTAKKVWTWLDGNKTTIGSVLMSGILIADDVTNIGDSTIKALLILSGTIFGVGVSHKAMKTGNKVMNNIKSKKDGRN